MDLQVNNQEDIICKVQSMDVQELLGLVIEHPFFLTDTYFFQVGLAVRNRYAELTSNVLAFYSFRV